MFKVRISAWHKTVKFVFDRWSIYCNSFLALNFMPSESKFKIISLWNVATCVRNMHLWEVEQCTCGLEPLVPLGDANQVRFGPATVVSGCLLQKSACLIWIFWIGTVQQRATSNCSTKSSCELNFKFHILFICFSFLFFFFFCNCTPCQQLQTAGCLLQICNQGNDRWLPAPDNPEHRKMCTQKICGVIELPEGFLQCNGVGNMCSGTWTHGAASLSLGKQGMSSLEAISMQRDMEKRHEEEMSFLLCHYSHSHYHLQQWWWFFSSSNNMLKFTKWALRNFKFGPT